MGAIAPGRVRRQRLGGVARREGDDYTAGPLDQGTVLVDEGGFHLGAAEIDRKRESHVKVLRVCRDMPIGACVSA